MEQAWLLVTASQVQSAHQGSLCFSMRTVLVSSGWSWSLSACIVGWQTTCPTPTPRTWSGLRLCCATCSLGHLDASSFKQINPYTWFASDEDVNVLISRDLNPQCCLRLGFTAQFYLLVSPWPNIPIFPLHMHSEGPPMSLFIASTYYDLNLNSAAWERVT